MYSQTPIANKIFRIYSQDLFYLNFQTMKKELEKRKQAQQNAKNSDANDNHWTGDSARLMEENLGLNDQHQNPMQSMFANICIFIGFAAFAYTVKYVLRSISAE